MVIDDGVNGVSDEEVCESAVEMGVESLVESGEADSGFMYLFEYFEGIVSLLLNWVKADGYLYVL